MTGSRGPSVGAPASSVAAGFIVVLASMVVLFVLPARFFVDATFGSMVCMIVVTYLLTRYRGMFKPSATSLAFGCATALALYLIFFAGNLGIKVLHPFGIGSSSESTIYALIASPSNPIYLQIGVLVFDAVGYESFFRGVLQKRLEPRMGLASVFAVALVDSLIHTVTLNPLWVATTFIADSVWGLTYFYSKDLSSSMTSHLLWDILIFIIIPIK